MHTPTHTAFQLQGGTWHAPIDKTTHTLIGLKCHATQTERPTDFFGFLTQGPALLLPSPHTVCAGNNIGDGGAAAIADALKTNTSVQAVDLRGICFVCALWTVFFCRLPPPAPPLHTKKGMPRSFSPLVCFGVIMRRCLTAFLFFCGASVGAVVVHSAPGHRWRPLPSPHCVCAALTRGVAWDRGRWGGGRGRTRRSLGAVTRCLGTKWRAANVVPAPAAQPLGRPQHCVERNVPCFVAGHMSEHLPLPSPHAVCAGNNIGDAAAIAIADALNTNTSVPGLYFRGMCFVRSVDCVLLLTPPPFRRAKRACPVAPQMRWGHAFLRGGGGGQGGLRAFVFGCPMNRQSETLRVVHKLTRSGQYSWDFPLAFGTRLPPLPPCPPFHLCRKDPLWPLVPLPPAGLSSCEGGGWGGGFLTSPGAVQGRGRVLCAVRPRQQMMHPLRFCGAVLPRFACGTVSHPISRHCHGLIISGPAMPFGTLLPPPTPLCCMQWHGSLAHPCATYLDTVIPILPGR